MPDELTPDSRRPGEQTPAAESVVSIRALELNLQDDRLAAATRSSVETPPARSPGSLAEKVAALENEVERLRLAESALLDSNDALRLLSETASQLLSCDKPQAAIDSLFETLAARLGLETYFNYLVDDEKGKLHLNSYAGIPPDVAKDIEWLEYGQAICGCVARDGSRIVAEDVQHSDDVRADLVRSFGVEAYACHPLIAQGRVVGTFSFGTTRQPYFAPHELALMQAVCDQVSLAMERSLLISELRRQEADQRLLAESGALLAASLDYEETLAAFAKLLVRDLADWCVVDLAEPSGALRRLAAAVHDAAPAALSDDLQAGQVLAADEVEALPRVVGSGEAELYADFSAQGPGVFSGNARERRMLSKLGARSAMVVPVKGRQRVLGTITLIGVGPGRTFGPRELDLAKELAYRAGVALENSLLYQEAKSAVQTRDDFLSVAAHELQTPVTSLRGFSQALVRNFQRDGHFDPSRLERALQIVDRQSAKLSRLVAQLLDVSRIEAGQLLVERRQVALGDVVKEAVESVSILHPEHDIALHLHEPIRVMADPLRLEQVIGILLDNALKFGGPGPVDVDVWSPAIATARIAVRDHGAGIPRERRDTIFDRFYGGHVADYTSGIGVGLYVARSIVELHGGTLEAEFPEDGGTRFVIALPTALADVKRRYSKQQEGRSGGESTGR